MFKLINKIKSNYNNRKKTLEANGLFYYFKNSNGSVLFIVIMLSTILFMVSVDFFLVANTNVQYTRKIKNEAQAKTIANTGIDIGKYILDIDKRGIGSAFIKGVNKNKKIDTHQDIWAIPLTVNGIDDNGDGSVKIIITDQQAKINISTLATELVDKTTYYGIFQRFLINMGLPIDYADTVIDWVDVDSTPSPYGGETYDFYSTLPKPYSAKNGQMDSIDEMMMIKNITPSIFYGLEKSDEDEESKTIDRVKPVDNNTGLKSQNILELFEKGIQKVPANELQVAPEASKKLSDYLRVEGDRKSFKSDYNKININTASYRVLSALTDNMTDAIVADIIKKRTSSPIGSVNDVSDLITDESVRNEILTVSSSIFQITAIGEYMDQVVTIRAIYNRKTKRFYYWSIY